MNEHQQEKHTNTQENNITTEEVDKTTLINCLKQSLANIDITLEHFESIAHDRQVKLGFHLDFNRVNF